MVHLSANLQTAHLHRKDMSRESITASHTLLQPWKQIQIWFRIRDGNFPKTLSGKTVVGHGKSAQRGMWRGR